MIRHFRPALVLLALFTLLTGFLYPLAVTGAAQWLFPVQANGSLVVAKGQIVGSRLIGQKFQEARYFQGRPSVAGADGYDAAQSGGSNLGPTSGMLQERIAARVAALAAQGIAHPPVDLVTASASGLDPHLSPAAALAQVPRVAAARGLAEETVARLVAQNIDARAGGILGEPVVNVLMLNLALNGMEP